MKKQTKKKKIEGPKVVHGKSDKAQGEWQKELLDDTRRKYCAVQGGKGSKRRVENTEIIRQNWDEINWGKK